MYKKRHFVVASVTLLVSSAYAMDSHIKKPSLSLPIKLSEPLSSPSTSFSLPKSASYARVARPSKENLYAQSMAKGLVKPDDPIPEGLNKAEVARQYFFMTGKYLTIDVDYGFSIEDLLIFKKMPKVKHDFIYRRDGSLGDPMVTLDLSNKKINNLKGLNTIRQPQKVTHLILSNNQLATVPDNILSSFKKLEMLNLSNNEFTSFRKDWFKGLNNFVILDVRGNKLGWRAKWKMRRLFDGVTILFD